MDLKELIKPVQFQNDALLILDQTLLPGQETYLTIKDVDEAVEAIKALKVRGAPAIGIAAAYAFLLGLKQAKVKNIEDLLEVSKVVKKKLENSRPTAVNLFHALKRMEEKLKSLVKQSKEVKEIIKELESEARAIHEEDLEASRKIVKNALEVFKDCPDKLNVLTHCNTGALATGGLGTALAVVRGLNEVGKLGKVYATETRPLFQGARLTAFELEKYGFDYEVIVDSASAFLMAQGKIDAVIVGADRVAKNGDTANKIGTFSLALAAYYFNIPFFVVCPVSTLDGKISDGSQIPIEFRSPFEIGYLNTYQIAANPERCLNPAFDITPAKFISAIITDKDVKIIRGFSW